MRKRRLATTRGLTQPHITPTNSPTRQPVCSSTPAVLKPLPLPLQGVSALSGGRKLPPHPPFSPVGQGQFFTEAIRVSVISPLIGSGRTDTEIDRDPSLDWDNFQDCPSYKDILPSNYTEGIKNIIGVEENKKITLVDTSVSSLTSSESMTIPNMSQQSEPKVLSEEEKAVLLTQMQQDNTTLADLKDLLYDLMEDYSSSNVRRGNVELVQKELDKISNARQELRKFVRTYKQNYSQINSSNCEIAENILNQANKNVREHADLIWTKVEEIQDQQRSATQKHSDPPSSVTEKETVDPRIIIRDSSNSATQNDLAYKQNMYRDQLLYLREALCLPQSGTIKEHWQDKSNSDICQAMKDLGRWQASLEKLSSSFREYERLCGIVGTPAEFNSDNDDFEEIRNKVKEVIIAVKEEDTRRNLQTLLPNVSDKVKYPVFSGETGEDLLKFKDKMQECFRKNRILESDQLDKLRENLKGQALKRVPDSVKSLETAWKNLSDAFGSPMIVLKERLKGLVKLGTMPADTSPNKQISWFLDFESVLNDIIDLGSSTDLNMQMGAFGPPVQESILKAFNDHPQKKREIAMSGYNLQPKEKIIAYQSKVQGFRQEVQLTEVECGSVADKKKSSNSGLPTVDNVGQNDSCRVCLHFRNLGNTQKFALFENHLGEGIFQCPVFMRLKIKERINVASKIKLCQYCLDNKVQTDRQHERLCKDKKPQFSESWKCASPGCGRHSWICQTHADNANKKKLKRYAERLFKKGFQFSYPVVLDSVSLSSSSRISAVEDIGTQIDKELLPVPSGHPMFLFYGAKGKTRSLMTFFDSGCSKFIVRDCIPGQELPASCLSKEKIPIGGIGASTVFAEGEYLVAMDTVDGKAQLMQGLAVKTITSEFPKFDLSDAAAEVLRAAPRNKELELRRCKFPDSIGGSVDCLIGIQYSQLQPRLIHMLPSGLAVYKTKLAPHMEGYNYVLGGAHTSFNIWLAQCGNQNHVLLENLIAGLARWRDFGPPSLTQYAMSESEVKFAKDCNLLDDKFDSYEELVEFENKEFEDINSEIIKRVNELNSSQSASGLDYCNTYTLNKICVDCGDEFSYNFPTFEDEKLSRLKHILDSQETGFDISYRCVRCRDCLDCRNAEKVDRISLREEAEDFEIRNSVKLDWDNKRIVVSLPLRGRERDFLTSNENRAVKVLNSQCKKYFKDETACIGVNEAFRKLIEKGFIKFLDDMSSSEKNKFLHKEVQYFLPWRIQFKPDSASTPIRVVFDASSCTSRRKDNSGGRCLNDLVCKGSIDTLDLMRVILRFMIGRVALVADISKMYNQFSLLPEYWNLQRVLIKEDLNPEGPIKHAVVTTAIYGVKSSSGQTEHGLREIADHVKEEKPDVSKLLTSGRYVDNLMDSKVSKEEALLVAKHTTEVLNRLNVPTKGFSFSGEDPQPEETVDGTSIDVNGMRWITSVDAVEVKIPPLHFGTKCRGRVTGVDFFENGGSLAKMDEFVPKSLTRRMIFSKRAGLYYFLGKLEPIKAKLKLDEREVVLLTKDWDDVVDVNIRSKWLKNFLLIEQLRGIKFSRARMPDTALNSRMRLITVVDAAEQIIMMVTYCGFRLKEGGWSCQQLLGRSVLGNYTIPRNELDGVNGGSNMAVIIKKALPDWVESSIQATDSEIALHWIISDSRKLSMWHRNRVIQIRRNIDFENLFYVNTESNVADIGTRADKVSIADIGPDSRYENGDSWMQMDISDVIDQKVLRPASDLKPIPVEKETEFREGFLIEREPEVLTRGHVSEQVENLRIQKIAERAEFSDYGPLLPTNRRFPVMVRIAGYVIAFITKCRDRADKGRNITRGWTGPLLKEASIWFTAFPGRSCNGDVAHFGAFANGDSSQLAGNLVHSFSINKTLYSTDKFFLVHSDENSCLTDRFLNSALLYYFRVASQEVLQFNNRKVVEKRTELKDGVLLSKGRIIEGMNFLETADLDTLNLDKLCIKTKIPVIDRYSPLAYSLAQHFHWSIARHKGIETCLRYSLEHVHILQGMSLFKELSEECIRCKMKRGRFIKASLGPLSDKQLIVAPAFYACQVDLCGPWRVFVPGFEKETRSSKIKESKAWIFVAVCVVTGAVNLQVCELKDTGAMLEAFIRLSCEVGYPKYVMCDKESSLMNALSEIKVNLRDLSHQLYSEHGMLFETCAVGGHDQHGKVERAIKTIQESLDEVGWRNMRLHAMGIQTLCKQVENSYNNLPLGFRYDRADDNTKTLKMITPNILRIGRINSRALDGPVRLSNDTRKMLSDINEKYAVWYKLWCEVYVPKLMSQKKDFRSDRDLEKDDLVYYQKKDGNLNNAWVIGKVDQVVRSRDGIIRKVIVKYQNSKEEFSRVTERSIRSLIKLWSIDDPDLHADLQIIQARIDELRGQKQRDGEDGQGSCLGLVVEKKEDCLHGVLVRPVRGEDLKCGCCCTSHCSVGFHNLYGSRSYQHEFLDLGLMEKTAIVDGCEDKFSEEDDGEDGSLGSGADSLTSYLMSVHSAFAQF